MGGRTRRNMRITCWSILCLFCALFCLYPKRGNAFVLGSGTFFDWIESVGIIYCAFDIYGYGHELTFLILHLDTYITQGGAAWGILRLVLWPGEAWVARVASDPVSLSADWIWWYNSSQRPKLFDLAQCRGRAVYQHHVPKARLDSTRFRLHLAS